MFMTYLYKCVKLTYNGELMSSLHLSICMMDLNDIWFVAQTKNCWKNLILVCIGQL